MPEQTSTDAPPPRLTLTIGTYPWPTTVARDLLEEAAHARQADTGRYWHDLLEEAEAHFADRKRLTPAEAVFGVLSWLTTRKESIVLGASDDAAPAADAARRFCEVNGLGDCGPTWPDALVHPK